jgi:hypothetical protein
MSHPVRKDEFSDPWNSNEIDNINKIYGYISSCESQLPPVRAIIKNIRIIKIKRIMAEFDEF